jgi:hypothetical protein
MRSFLMLLIVLLVGCTTSPQSPEPVEQEPVIVPVVDTGFPVTGEVVAEIAVLGEQVWQALTGLNGQSSVLVSRDVATTLRTTVLREVALIAFNEYMQTGILPSPDSLVLTVRAKLQTKKGG